MPYVRAGRPGLLGTLSRSAVVAGSARLTALAVDRAERRRAKAAYTAAEQAPDDVVAKIEQLVRLRDRGVLSDAEFQTAKALVLAV